MTADVLKAGSPTRGPHRAPRDGVASRGLCALGCKWVLLVSLVLSLVLLLPAGVYAQEATFAGTVTDLTSGVLPGVTITAVHEATGNRFTAVTDDRGEFRLPVRVGGYSIAVELSGFTTVNRNVQILVGQIAVVNVQMAPSAVQETVTVTGEAPLVDMTSSTIGANIDPRQMQELPLNGRNWMDLTLLAPGARRNESGGLVQLRQGYAQTNDLQRRPLRFCPELVRPRPDRRGRVGRPQTDGGPGAAAGLRHQHRAVRVVA